MDTREYELEYDDGTHDCYFDNVIADNQYSQVESERHQFLVLEEVSDHWCDGTAVAVANGFTIIQGGIKHTEKIMCG